MALFKGYAMKKLLSLLLLTALFLLPACGNKDTGDTGEFTMVAEIVRIEDKIEVTVTESPVASGTYLVITGEDTVYENKKGKRISREELSVGDSILISYSGQVMMSMPPQIVALSIQLQ